MTTGTPPELPPPSGAAVATEPAGPPPASTGPAGDWAPPTGPAAPTLRASAARRENTNSDSRAWVFAAVVIGAVVLLLIFLAVVSSVVGAGSSFRSGDPLGPGAVELTPASRDVSATLLSGYDRRGMSVDDDGEEVLAASVRIENPTGAEQQYFVRVRFLDSDERRLAAKRLQPLVGPGEVLTRNLFTGVPRPSGAEVTVTVSAERTDPLSLRP